MGRKIRGRAWSPLQFITNGTDVGSTVRGAELALKGGCRWIQLRMKGFGHDDVISAVKLLKPLCAANNAVLLIDDEVALAREYNLDGVHLGLNDMPIDEARRILGDGFIIGGTANTLEQARHQMSLGADYLGIGPFRFTTTKKNLSPVLGLDGYRSVMDDLKDEIPVVAIGGIERSDIRDVMSAGVDGIAVSGTILRADDPVNETLEILNILWRN